jgi:tRNA threonylcarbamoyladenosine modification (KEOPS) complex Cgi121 subunit
VEFACVIVREFKIEDLNLNFFVGINQIKINQDRFINFKENDEKEKLLNQFFNIIEKVQNKYEHSVLQFIKDKYILNQNHIFTACYYLEKAFLYNVNISKTKNIELLLYLAANRQINKSMEGFGIDYSDLCESKLTYCIISPKNNINNIGVEISNVLYANEEKVTLNNQSNNKINLIKNYFNFSNDQINCVQKSYGINPNNSESLNSLALVIEDLICEKMALLYIEKTTKVV